jgi:hypothetical protein
VPRAEHTAALLPSGEVLVSGGEGASGGIITNELVGPAAADTVAPAVVATSPADRAVGVDLGAIVGIRFSEPVDVRTITAGVVEVTSGGVPVPGTVSAGESGLYAFFLPSTPLLPGTTYRVTVGARCGREDDDRSDDDRCTILDLAGNPLVTRTFQFTTVSAPAILRLVPDRGPVGASVTIEGSLFDPAGPERNLATVGGVRATVTAATTTTLAVIVPDLPSGPARVAVQTRGGLAVSPQDFLVENERPVVNAGADQTVVLRDNLLDNPGNDEALIGGTIRAWTAVSGSWSQASAGTGLFPPSLEGPTYFAAGSGSDAELRQDVDVSAFAAAIDGGAQSFALKGFLRASNEDPAGRPRLVVEYRDAANQTVLGAFDSGEISTSAYWHQASASLVAPAGTRVIRVRLISASGLTSGGYFDAVSIRVLGTAPAATVQLVGTATDDGLPSGVLNVAWSAVDPPGPVTFADANQAVTTATFTVAGTYRLRLTVTDTQLSAGAEVLVTVVQQNRAPRVSAGADLTLSLPRDTATLDGSATDDGLPAGGALNVRWSQLTGPQPVTFGSPRAAATTVAFRAAGTYRLRLLATDSERVAAADVTVTLTGPNRPPVVDAGPSQSIPHSGAGATLAGSVTDDGLPAGGALSTSWSAVSGPGTVTFTTGDRPATDARFAAEGTYVLRLTASDTELTSSAEVTVTVGPLVDAPPSVDAEPASAATTVTTPGPGTNAFRLTASDGQHSSSGETTVTVSTPPLPVVNAPPIVKAVPNRTLTLPETSVTLEGSAQDDGRPLGNPTVTAPNASNQLPSVSAGPDRTIALANAVVSLGGSATDDGLPTGSLLVSWTTVDGPCAAAFDDPSSSATNARFSEPGLYRLRLTASDGELTSSDDVTVTVTAGGANRRPVVNAGPSQTITQPLHVATLSGIVTDDGLPNGALTVQWTALSGADAVQFADPGLPVTTATFARPGVFTLQLSASDGQLTATATTTVTVNAAIVTPPFDNFLCSP